MSNVMPPRFAPERLLVLGLQMLLRRFARAKNSRSSAKAVATRGAKLEQCVCRDVALWQLLSGVRGSGVAGRSPQEKLASWCAEAEAVSRAAAAIIVRCPVGVQKAVFVFNRTAFVVEAAHNRSSERTASSYA